MTAHRASRVLFNNVHCIGQQKDKRRHLRVPWYHVIEYNRHVLPVVCISSISLLDIVVMHIFCSGLRTAGLSSGNLIQNSIAYP